MTLMMRCLRSPGTAPSLPETTAGCPQLQAYFGAARSSGVSCVVEIGLRTVPGCSLPFLGGYKGRDVVNAWCCSTQRQCDRTDLLVNLMFPLLADYTKCLTSELQVHLLENHQHNGTCERSALQGPFKGTLVAQNDLGA